MKEGNTAAGTVTVLKTDFRNGMTKIFKITRLNPEKNVAVVCKKLKNHYTIVFCVC